MDIDDQYALSFDADVDPAQAGEFVSAGSDMYIDEEDETEEESVIPTLETDLDLDEALEAAGSKLVVLDFTAKWCGPCQKLAPILEELAKKHGSKVCFYKCDVPKRAAPGLAHARGVTRLPALHFFKDGEQIEEIIGFDLPAIKAQIAKATQPFIVRILRSSEMLVGLAAAYAASMCVDWKRLFGRA